MVTKYQSITFQETSQFLEALFGSAPPEQFLEFRSITIQGKVLQEFLPISTLQRNGFSRVLPYRRDGKANVYYGVAPRVAKRGTADYVSSAGALWVDEIREHIPQGLPIWSLRVETSPGKCQTLWLLDSYTEELDRVEALNETLGQVLRGDTVWDRPRVLRLPGFKNIKYPDQPRAKLVHFRPDWRYSLDQMENALKTLGTSLSTSSPRANRASASLFDPHWGTPLPGTTQAFLRKLFTSDWNLKPQHNGRYSGACPFPHLDGACECKSAFYISPVTGQWFCFCSDHQVTKPGAVASGGIKAVRSRLDREIPGIVSWHRPQRRVYRATNWEVEGHD